jgi:phage gpG-like protein
MITVKAAVIGDQQVVARLEGLTPRIQDAVVGALNEYSQELAGTIKEDKLSGQVLNVQTGALRDSIAPLEAVKGEVMSGGAGGGAGIVYAAIHEYGGTITAKRAPYLRFRTADGRWHAVKSVVMPERSYMRSSFRETYEQGLQLVRDAVMEGVSA